MTTSAVPPRVWDSSIGRRQFRRRATIRKANRRASSLAGALATVALLSSPPTQAATVLTIEPLNLGQGPLIDTELGGALCAAPNTCTAVQYPASLSLTSIPDGASILNSLIGPATKPVVVFGYSEGAQVAGTWMAQYGKGPDAPAAQDVSFVLIGNPNRAYGGASNALAKVLNIAAPEDTQYQVTDVAREYDFWADLPTGPLNSIALVNAIAGSLFIHTDYTKVDLTDPNNVTWKEGNITYVLVPTPTLPMFLPLKWVGMGALADSLSAQYRPIVDSAYNRPVPVSVPAQTATTAAATPAATAPAASAEVTPASRSAKVARPAAVSNTKNRRVPAPTGAAASSATAAPTSSLREAPSAASKSSREAGPAGASKSSRR